MAWFDCGLSVERGEKTVWAIWFLLIWLCEKRFWKPKISSYALRLLLVLCEGISKDFEMHKKVTFTRGFLELECWSISELVYLAFRGDLNLFWNFDE